MSAEDVAEAIMRLEEPIDRDKLAEGDVSALEGLELTSEELALIVEGVEPETAGFSASEVMTACVDPTKGRRGAFFDAAMYASPKLSDPGVRAKFNAFLARNNSANF